MRYKIIIDSCGELLDEWKQDEHFESVPLTLMVGAEQIKKRMLYFSTPDIISGWRRNHR